MKPEIDRDYYQNVDGEKEDIYDCPVLNAKTNAPKTSSNASSQSSSSQLSRALRRTKPRSHPTNQR